MRNKVIELKKQQENLRKQGKSTVKDLKEQQKRLRSGELINQPKFVLKREKIKKIKLAKLYGVSN